MKTCPSLKSRSVGSILRRRRGAVSSGLLIGIAGALISISWPADIWESRAVVHLPPDFEREENRWLESVRQRDYWAHELYGTPLSPMTY